MASTGNTQGMRLRIRPPIKPPSRAAQRLPALAALPAGTVCEAVLLASSAAARAGETPASAGALQRPCTASSLRQPALSPRSSAAARSAGGKASTTASCAAVSPRISDSGMFSPTQTSPSQCCFQSLPDSAACLKVSAFSG
ncbi:hypothetical protein SDC9_152829 [bioreactor metagenome]|uniref:Uncharacterized protein n=1 Tax=bioreactor metagenome TaxID=1076179 RepID=A0A645EU60_9ZZZZ